MDTKILKDMITVIRTEQERRASLLRDEDPDFAYDKWLFTDGPFLNELCLMFLVTLRHQIEREIVGLAARADEIQKEISGNQYQENIKKLRKTNNTGRNIGWEWKEIYKKLDLENCENYKFVEALRLLSNSYKHEPSMEPNDELLNFLGLEIGVNYASLPESDALREGFAKLIGIKEDGDFCDIAERFIDISKDFLINVESRANLCKVKWGPVSLNPADFAR
jgi:hypothetical protein